MDEYEEAVECVGEEKVTIPARLLRDLVWAAEALSEIEWDKDDRAMIQTARRALEEQAPETTWVMLAVDVKHDGALTEWQERNAQSDGSESGE